jgi:hypothetical protein
MKAWAFTLAATVVLVIGTSVYDLNGRIADAVQKIETRHHESPVAQQAYFARQLERWAPDDSLSVLFACVPAGGVLALGLIVSFIVLAATQGRGNWPTVVVCAIGVIGCAAVVCGNDWRVQEFDKAGAAFAEWGKTAPASGEWAMRRDGFLAHLVMMKWASLLMTAGLIATGLALGYGTVLAAAQKERPPSAGANQS